LFFQQETVAKTTKGSNNKHAWNIPTQYRGGSKTTSGGKHKHVGISQLNTVLEQCDLETILGFQ
jgi:hypothetical protein